MFFLVIEESSHQHSSEQVIGIVVADNKKEAAKKIGKMRIKHPQPDYDYWLEPVEEFSTPEQLQQFFHDEKYIF